MILQQVEAPFGKLYLQEQGVGNGMTKSKARSKKVPAKTGIAQFFFKFFYMQVSSVVTYYYFSINNIAQKLSRFDHRF